jgi:PEP-CTERM motif
MSIRSLLTACLLSGMAGISGAATFVPLDSAATFLHTFGDSPTPPPALALRLADYGFAPGDRLILQAQGDIDNGPGGDTFDFTIGVFSSSDELLANDQRYRVTGAVASDGPGFVSLVTYIDSHPTDIEQDFGFDKTAITVTVPLGANVLFLAKHDNWYHDNSDPDHDYGVLIGLAPVPEPATWALMAGGLGVLAARARRRSKSRCA